MRRSAHPCLLVVVTSAALLASSCSGATSTDLVGPTDVRCAIAVTPSEAPVGASRETGSIAVSAERECAWSATTTAGWIALTSGSGQGDGRVEYVVAENPSPSVRRGVIAISGHEVAIVQDAAPCSFRLSGSDASVAADGGTVGIHVESFPGCTWTAASHEGWIVVSSGGDGDGSGTVQLEVASNPGPPRTGLVTIAEQPFTITQGAECTAGIGHTASHVPAAGGSSTVDIVTQPWCEWTAVSHVPWIDIAGGDRGSGPGSVTLAIGANAGPPRSGGVTIAGHLHTVTQEAVPCTYQLSPSAQRVPFAGGTYTVMVITEPWCQWSAVSHVNWIQIASGHGGAGHDTVTYQVSSRSFPLPRTGTLTIAGETFTVTQTLIVSSDDPSAVP